ncbi:MAG: hypothetical protein JSW33_04885 [bacterium]|nr:MAG: hypothetical protein JSW33_04885 [bacterium]
MLQKVMYFILAVLLIVSLSSLLAEDSPLVTSTYQQAQIEDQVPPPQNVSEMRTVTVRGTIKIRPTRTSQVATTVSRDPGAAKSTGQPTVQSRQGERIFQQPMQKRTNQLNHKNVQESPATLD